MQTKLFEIRDEGTLIVAMATRLRPGNDRDRRLLARAGFGTSVEAQSGYVILSKLTGGDHATTYDPYGWGAECRTMREAHKHIIAKFDELENGAVIDVQFLLGERTEPKKSEMAA